MSGEDNVLPNGTRVTEVIGYSGPRVGEVTGTCETLGVENTPIRMYRVTWETGTHGWFPETALIVYNG